MHACMHLYFCVRVFFTFELKTGFRARYYIRMCVNKKISICGSTSTSKNEFGVKKEALKS